jgi:hypothetical protein
VTASEKKRELWDRKPLGDTIKFLPTCLLTLLVVVVPPNYPINTRSCLFFLESCVLAWIIIFNWSHYAPFYQLLIIAKYICFYLTLIWLSLTPTCFQSYIVSITFWSTPLQSYIVSNLIGFDWHMAEDQVALLKRPNFQRQKKISEASSTDQPVSQVSYISYQSS